MRKLFIALAFAGFAMGVNAQEADPVQQYSVATNSFWSNWFVQAGADWSAWYSNEEHGLGLSHSPFKKFRTNPGASIAVGKWFTPGIGLRTKLQGIWGKAVTDDNNAGNGMKYWTLNEHVMFNMSNLLFGYNPKRVWNVIPFAGAGMSRNCTANKYAMQLSHLYSSATVEGNRRQLAVATLADGVDVGAVDTHLHEFVSNSSGTFLRELLVELCRTGGAVSIASDIELATIVLSILCKSLDVDEILL